MSQRGHAIEVRVYAEDPARNDLPQAGPLLLYREPSMPGIRVDAGVVEGAEVSVHYDPLLAKLIAWGETRDAARRRALAALRSYPILGIRTNIALLIELLEHPRFIAGALDTGFLDAEGDAIRARLRDEAPPVVSAVAAAAARAGPGSAATDARPRTTRGPPTRGPPSGARVSKPARRTSRSTSCRLATAATSSQEGSSTQIAFAVATARETWVFLDGRVYLVGSSGDARARVGIDGRRAMRWPRRCRRPW